ncbi:hypothetical protein CGRA01v4_07491 [Colletotrichum graminicola]|nr:hypothetical protein CGRA01v4_07491 [Colletotrichum graminicola]
MRGTTWWARGEEASPLTERGGGIVFFFFSRLGFLARDWVSLLVGFVLSGLREGLVSCPWSWPFDGRKQVVGKKKKCQVKGDTHAQGLPVCMVSGLLRSNQRQPQHSM